MKDTVHEVIREHTVSTVLDTIECSGHMESESILLVDTLSSRDILSPGEFDLVPVVLTLWRRHDRMPCDGRWGNLQMCEERMECLPDLCLLDRKLFSVGDREPPTPTIELPSLGNRSLDRRRSHRTHDLRFEMIFLHSGHPQIDDRIGDSATRDDDAPPIRSRRES